MFGYATDETEALMPMPIHLAHRLAERLAAVRKDGSLDYLGPDGKTQVTVRYADGRPVKVEKLLISTQHAEGVESESKIKPDLWESVVLPVLGAEAAGLFDADELRQHFLVNPTGKFVIGGPVGDAGLTGRKIIVDTYGGMARHGGGAFSGKDPSKVDRSAAYAARHVAKNVVAAGLAQRCEVQVAYAIGVAHPVSLMVETFGTGKLPDRRDLAPGRSRVRPPPGRLPPLPRPAPPDLPEDRRLRPLRPRGRRLHLGAHRPRRRAARRRRPRDRRRLAPERCRVGLRRCGGWALAQAVASPAAIAPGRLVDAVDDVAGVGDADEDEVVVVARGGVEVDVADLHQPLVDASGGS